ncbi:MAG TPA: class I SAM-dependent methyltransferase [Gammaproteobacteria bacterium]|nr:class I SAM-dependent methyltransferase [Gammaproteobacteria bacterium]
MHSYQTLENKLHLEQSLPVNENWTAAADFLHLLADYCLREKPETIVECSSGASTLVLSRCCQLNEKGRVYSLENGAEFVQQTRQQLDDFGLADYASVLHAPMKDYLLRNRKFQWYDLTHFYPRGIDLLVIDGPPGVMQKHSRYPALPLLGSHLARQCLIFLDDASRPDERDIVRCWMQEHDEFETEFVDTERGCSVLIRR